MTEQSPTRPVPGPPRPVPAPGPTEGAPSGGTGGIGEEPAGEDRFADLDEQPVAAHVAVFEAEHSRLQRELGTIDQL
jgi:hypothetical protein